MARDYFIQTTSLVPPRGVRVEMTEIRPLRPNQAVILPGVAVRGHGLKFEVKEKTKYRSRSGFAQSDGIAQFSATYNNRKPYRRTLNIIEDDFRPPSYEPYRPQQPRSLFPYCSDDESYLNRRNSSRLNSPSTFPELKITNGPQKPLYPTSKKSIVPILKTEATSKNVKKKNHVPPWELAQTRETKLPNFQNLIFATSDDELLKQQQPPQNMAYNFSYTNGMTSPKFASHHALCTNQGRNKATSNLGVMNTYDFLFDRHLRLLTNMESDQEDLVNEDEVKTLNSIHQPLHTPREEEEEESLTESDELSMIGEDLVNRSLAEVTSLLDQQMDLNRVDQSKESNKKTKRISFLVPSSVPRISISSAGSADESVVNES